ncbi:cob(I)yrinic acid a,c-diamide adenosyltransferase [Catalinimonas niigatensis]|uniref:cob(I)yrinic acid a,c-diamide adenosyltransferase n=1 Tax=Catalinimonas niigatensis TaxID=1397264 RepID=UPI0026653DB2|nr:cob(I)yrinic acid a,c-diamide adenosyltransferase [Catalinimonas niigatensis]WPP50655.1 cob(I)yrinic acid a,c-diamide adenosyltransferase [Catalinimonas niigatensis]
MKIYTKTGDQGNTSLIGGIRVPKSHDRVEAYGTVDELNSFIGIVRDMSVNETRQSIFQHIQETLFVMGSLLAADPGKKPSYLPDLQEEDILQLEQAIDQMQDELPEMKHFILPGGHPDVSNCHLARAVCRRAERTVVRLHEKEEVDANIIVYLNRLSDYLFVLARYIGKEHQVAEIPWKPRKK